MARNPDGEQKTSGNFWQRDKYLIQWCKYLIQKARPNRLQKIGKQAEKATKLAVQEESRRKAEEAKEVRQAQKSLKQVEKTCAQLRAGKTGTEEAIQKLSDISARITK